MTTTPSQRRHVAEASHHGHAAAVDTTKVAQHFGTYRVLQVPTPQDRRVMLWTTAVAVALLTGWGVIRFRRDGVDGALDVLVYVIGIAAASVLMGLAGRWWGPQTRLDANGVRVMTGLTGGRHIVAWDEVTDVQAASRFGGHPVAVLRDGARLELPGVPVAVVEHLGAAPAEEGSRVAPSSKAPAVPSAQDDGAWEGPFRRG